MAMNGERAMQWLREYKPGTAQWISRRGGRDNLRPRAKRAIKLQIREARRALKQNTPQGIALKIKRERRRYLTQARTEHKKAVEHQYGSQGAASIVRHIEPTSIEVAKYLK